MMRPYGDEFGTGLPSGSKDMPSSMLVLFDPARSAEPPQNSGSTGAIALMTLPDATRVATLVPVSKTGIAASKSSGSFSARMRSRRAAFSAWLSRQALYCSVHFSWASLAAPDSLTGMREHLVIDLEALVRVGSEDLLDRAHFFSTEIGSVGLARVLQFGAGQPMIERIPDDGRSVDICLALEDHGIHGVDIDGTVGQQIGVQGLPAVRLVALQDVLGEGDVSVAPAIEMWLSS